jgi:hypothetical protein
MTDEVYRNDIPLPQPKRGRMNESLTALAMGCPVGSSFFVPGITSQKLGGGLSYVRRKGMAFSCRNVTENGVAGVRIWRTA